MLTWLFHLIGDIHQPLHSTALFSTKLFPEGDRGTWGVRAADHGATGRSGRSRVHFGLALKRQSVPLAHRVLEERVGAGKAPPPLDLDAPPFLQELQRQSRPYQRDSTWPDHIELA